MISIINDTPVSFCPPDNIVGTYGGTASFLSGFLKHLLKQRPQAVLLGNFNNFTGTPFLCKTIKASSNVTFMVKMCLYLIFSKKKSGNTVFYCHRPDHLAITLMSEGKHIVHLHGQPHTTINSGRRRITKSFYNLLEKYALTRADLIIATDRITANLYITLYPAIKSLLCIIPTGVNLEEFNIDNKTQPFPGILPETSNLVYIGRLAYPKQVSLIIDTFSNAFVNKPSTHLWIAGTGPDENKLRLQASQTSCYANIHFTGQLTREYVKSLIHSSDAGILLSNNEGSPITVKEFLASGKPVIVNDVGDVCQYITDGTNGYIVDPQIPGSLQNAMWKIIDRAKEMAPFCRASMLPYDDEKIFGRVYRALLNLQQV